MYAHNKKKVTWGKQEIKTSRNYTTESNPKWFQILNLSNRNFEITMLTDQELKKKTENYNRELKTIENENWN